MILRERVPLRLPRAGCSSLRCSLCALCPHGRKRLSVKSGSIRAWRIERGFTDNRMKARTTRAVGAPGALQWLADCRLHRRRG